MVFEIKKKHLEKEINNVRTFLSSGKIAVALEAILSLKMYLDVVEDNEKLSELKKYVDEIYCNNIDSFDKKRIHSAYERLNCMFSFGDHFLPEEYSLILSIMVEFVQIERYVHLDSDELSKLLTIRKKFQEFIGVRENKKEIMKIEEWIKRNDFTLKPIESLCEFVVEPDRYFISK